MEIVTNVTKERISCAVTQMFSGWFWLMHGLGTRSTWSTNDTHWNSFWTKFFLNWIEDCYCNRAYKQKYINFLHNFFLMIDFLGTSFLQFSWLLVTRILLLKIWPLNTESKHQQFFFYKKNDKKHRTGIKLMGHIYKLYIYVFTLPPQFFPLCMLFSNAHAHAL
jgi:hypothetical protein